MTTFDQDAVSQEFVETLLSGNGYVSPRNRAETKAAAQWLLDQLQNDLSVKELIFLQDIADHGTDAYWYLDIKRYEITIDVLSNMEIDASDFIRTKLQHAKALYSHVNSHNDSFISANWALTACKDVLTPDENKFFHRVLNVGTLDFATLNNLFVDVMDRKLQQVSTAGTAPAPEQTLQKDQQLQKVLRTSLRTSLTTLLCSREYVVPVSYSTLIGAAQWLKQIAGSYLDLGEQQKLASFCNLPNTYSLDISATAKDFEVFKFSVTAHLLKENFDLARQLSASTGIFVDSYGFHTPQYKEEYQAAARWISRTFKEHIPASEQYNLQNAATNNLFGTLVLHNSWQIIKASMGVSTKAAVATESTESAAPTASTESSASATPVTSAASTVSAVDTASVSTLEDKGEEGIFISLLNSRGYPFSWHNTASNQAAAKWLLATAPQFLLPKERLVFEYLAAHATTQLELGDDLKYEHIARVVRTHYTKLESLESRKIIPEIDELGFHAPFGVDESKSALRWMLRHSLKTLHIDQELLTKLQQQAQHKSTDNNTVITMWHELKTMWLGLSAGAVAAGSVAEAGTGTGAGNGVSANAAIDDTNSDEDDEEDLFAEIYGDVSFGDDDDDYFDEVDTYVTAEPVTAPVKAPTRIDKAALIRALDESYLLLLQEILLLGSCYQEPTSSSQAKDSAQWLLTATDTLLKPEETQLLQQISSHGDAIFLLTRLKYQLTARFIQHHFADLTTDLFDIRIAPEGYHTPRNLSECQAAVSWLTTNYGNVIPHEEMSSLQNLAIYNNTDYKKVDEAWDKIHELMASGNVVDVDIAPAATIDSDSVTPTAVTAPASEQKPEPSTMSLFDDEVDDNYAYSDAVATAVPTSAAASVATPEAVSAPVSTPTAVHTQAPEGLQDSDELEEFAEIPVPADTDSSINFSDLSAQPMAGSPNSFAAGYQSPHSVAETKTAAAYILSHFSSQLSASDASSLKTIASLGTTQFAELDNIYNRALNNILYQQFIGSVLPTTQADITPDFEEFEPDLDQDFEYALEKEVEEEYEYEEADDDSDLEDEPEHESASELEAAEASEYGLEDEDTVLSAFDSTDSDEAQEQPNTEDEAAPEPEVAVDSPLEEYVSPTTVYMSKLVAKFLLSKHVHYLSEEDRTFLTDVCYGGTDDFAAIDNIYNAIKERIAQEEIDAELSSLVENDAEEALTPETEPEEASDDGLGEDTSVLPPAVAPLFAGYISPTTSAMSIFAAKFILNKLGAFLKANERVFLTDVCYGGTDNFAAVDAIYNDIKERCIAQASVIANTYDTEAKREREREREQKQEYKRMRDLNAQEALNQPTDPQVLLADYIAPTSITMSVFAAKFLLTKLGKYLEKSERDFLSDVCYDGTEDFAAIDSIYNAIKERVAAATRTDDIADEMNEYEARNALGDYVEPYSLSSSKQSALYLLSNFKEHMSAEDVSFLVYTAKNGSYNFNRLNDLYLYAQELYSPASDLDEAGVTPSNDAKSDNAASITSTNSSNSAPQISEEYEYVEPYSLYSSRLSAVYLLHHFKKQLSEDDLSFLRHAAKNGSYNFDRLNEIYKSASTPAEPDEYIKPYSIASSKKAAAFLLSHYQEHISGNDSYYLERAAKWGTTDFELLNSIHQHAIVTANAAKRAYAKTARVARIEAAPAATMTAVNTATATEAEADADANVDADEYIKPNSLASSKKAAAFLLSHYKKHIPDSNIRFLELTAKWGSTDFESINWIYQKVSAAAAAEDAAYVYTKPVDINTCKEAASYLLRQYQEHLSDDDLKFLKLVAKIGSYNFTRIDRIYNKVRAVSNPQVDTDDAAYAADTNSAPDIEVVEERAEAETAAEAEIEGAAEAETEADSSTSSMASDQSNDTYTEPYDLESSKQAAAYILLHGPKQIIADDRNFLKQTAKWGSYNFGRINSIYHNSFAGSTTAPSSTQPQRDAGFDANNQQSVQALHRKLLLGLEYKSPTQWIDGKTSANWLLENVSFLLNADEKAYLQDLVEVRSFDWTKVDLIKYAVTARFIKQHFAEIQSNRLGIAQGASGYHSPQTKAESKSAAQWVLKQFDNRLSTFDRQNLEKIASYGLSDPSSFDDIWRTIKASISYAESVSVATADANSAADSSADNSSNKPAQNHEQQGLKDSEKVQEGAAAPETAPAPTTATATAPVPATKTVQAPTPAQTVEKAESHTAAIDANADNAANDDSAHGEKAMAVIRQLLSLPQLHTVMAEALRVMRVAKDVISPQEREEFARFVNNVKIPVQSVIDLKYKLIARLVRENYDLLSQQDLGVAIDPCGYYSPQTPEERHAAAALIVELFEPELYAAERMFFKMAQAQTDSDVDAQWQKIKERVQRAAKQRWEGSNDQQTTAASEIDEPQTLSKNFEPATAPEPQVETKADAEPAAEANVEAEAKAEDEVEAENAAAANLNLSGLSLSEKSAVITVQQLLESSQRNSGAVTATAPVPATKTVQAPTPAQTVEKAESHTAAIDANADNAANDDSAHGEKAMAVIRQLLSLPQLHTVMAEALRVMRVAKDVISPQEREEFARFVNNVKIPVQSVIDLKYKLIARLVRENYNTISKQDFGVSFDPCGYFAPRTPEEKHAAAAMILELFEPKLSSAERSFFKLAQSSPSWDVDGKWQTIKDHVQGVAKPQSTSSNQQQTSKTAPQSESAASTAVSATVPETVPALPPTAMNGLSAQEQQVVTAIHNLMHQPQLTKGYEEAQRVINIAGSLLQSNERELLNQIVSTKQEAIQPAINLKYKVIANLASQYYALLTQKVKGFAFDPCGYFTPRTPEEKHAAAAMIIERFVLDLDAQERDFFRLAKSNPAMDIDREWQKVKGHVQLDAYKRIVANTTKPQQKAQAEHTNCKSESAKPAPTPAHAQTQAQSKAQVQAQVKVKTQSPALSQTTLKGVSPQEYQLILTVHNLVNQPQLNKGYEEAQRLIEVVDVFLQQHERLLLKHIKSTQQTEVQPAVNLKYKIIARLARQYYELMQEQNMGVSFDICGYFAPRTPEEKHAAAAMILERFNSTLNFNEQTFFKQALTDCTLDVDKKWHEFRERVQSEARQRSQNSPQQAQAQTQATQATQAVAVATQANTRNKRVLTAQDRQQLLEYKQVIVDGSGYQSPTCKADSNAAAQWQINMLSMFMTASEQQAMAKLAKYGTEQYYLLDRFRYRFTCKALQQLGFSPLEFQAHILQGSIGYRTPLSTAECRAAACWVFTCCYGYLNKNDTDTLQAIEKNGFNKFRDFEAFRNRIVHPIAKKITTLWQQHQSKQRPLPQAYDADTYQKFLRVTDALRAFKAKRANDSLRDSRKVSPAVGASRSAILQRAARTVAGFERHLEHQRERGYGVPRPQVPEPKPKKHKLGLKR